MIAQSVSRGVLVLHYFMMLIFCLVSAIAVLAVISYFNIASISTSAITILVPMFAASLAGNRYYRRAHAVPRGGFAWRMAAWFTLVALAANAVLVSLIFFAAAMGGIISSPPGTDEILAIATLSAVEAPIFLLVNRFGFWMGARSASRRAALDLFAASFSRFRRSGSDGHPIVAEPFAVQAPDDDPSFQRVTFQARQAAGIQSTGARPPARRR